VTVLKYFKIGIRKNSNTVTSLSVAFTYWLTEVFSKLSLLVENFINNCFAIVYPVYNFLLKLSLKLSLVTECKRM
jgi:hypothetical protein